MSNLRQSMTGEEWDSLSSPKIHYTRSEVIKLINELAKDLSIDDDFITDTWINNWIERKLEL
jgi:hypothetical protein